MGFQPNTSINANGGSGPWTAFLEPGLLSKMRRKMEVSNGGCLIETNGSCQAPWTAATFPSLIDRLVSVSLPGSSLEIENITVVGGWCALRTADVRNIQNGLLSDPRTGELRKYSTPEEVSRWLEHAVAFDQIIDAVGPYAGSKYVVFSEQYLWAERVIRAVSEYLGRELDPVACSLIGDSLRRAESIRFEAVQRYITSLTGERPAILMVTDREILEDLMDVRDRVLSDAGIPFPELIERFPSSASGLNGATIVWTTYTGEFIRLLQDRGYIQTSKALIVEPWEHATAESPARRVFNEHVFANGNAFLEPGGRQENVGFAGYIGTTFFDGTRSRHELPIGDVPNIRNHSRFVAMLRSSSSIGTLDPKANPAFAWGLNALSSGVERNRLLGLLHHYRAFKDEKKIVAQRHKGQSEMIQTEVANIKTLHSVAMHKEAIGLVEHLGLMFEHVFEPDLPFSLSRPISHRNETSLHDG